MNTPILEEELYEVLNYCNVSDINLATIRQTSDISAYLARSTGTEFIHLEMGIPGLAPEAIGTDAEHKALDEGKASIYPNMYGIPELKKASSRFLKAFLDIDLDEMGCIPTVGSMQGSFASYLLCSSLNEQKNKILFIDPGFPVQKVQTKVLGIETESFDIYDYRGDKLSDKLDSYLSHGNICAISYSNPNNPSWICLTENELKIIGELATKYDVIVVEDLAYFCMDFRSDLGKPFKLPFQPTVAKYTDNYMLLISASKVFSYAGQRIAITAISDKLRTRFYPRLNDRFNMPQFGDAYVLTILYAASAGVAHTTQYALAAMFNAAVEEKLNFVDNNKEYARRARLTKELFLKHGFHIVYDKDMDKDVSDGFFFTIGYKKLTGGELMRDLMLCAICTIALNTTGSLQNGVRICVSQLNDDTCFRILDERLSIFEQNHE